MTKILCKTKEDIEKLRKCSALTFTGCIDSDENLKDVTDWVNNYTKFVNDEPKYYIIKGKLMNDSYGLTGDNAYKDDLTFVCITPEDVINFNAFTLPRFAVGGRWMDDVIDNNLRREGMGE